MFPHQCLEATETEEHIGRKTQRKTERVLEIQRERNKTEMQREIGTR